MSFAILTDSTCDIPLSEFKDAGIWCIPLHVIIGGEDLIDQVEISSAEYLERMAATDELPHSSCPSVGEFTHVFDEIKAAGHDGAIYIGIAKSLSNSVESGRQAAAAYEGLDVRVIDSGTVSGTLGLLVERAKAGADAGMSIEDVVEDIERAKEEALLLIIPRTLENLVKNGRAPKLAGFAAQMLNLRLAVTTEWQTGEVKLAKKARGTKRIVDTVMTDALSFIGEHPGSTVRIVTTGGDEECALFTSALEGSGLTYDFHGTSTIGCTVATHLGTNAAGIAVLPPLGK